MPAQFQISPRLQSLIKRWPSRVTEDIPEIQDFVDDDFPTPSLATGNKATSVYFSKSDGTLFQIFAANSDLNNEMQASQF